MTCHRPPANRRPFDDVTAGSAWGPLRNRKRSAFLIYDKTTSNFSLLSGGRTRTRTWDPLIKSQLLYQLSYAPYANEINELYQSTQSVSVFGGFRSPSAWPFQGCRGGQTYGWRRTYMRSRGSRLQRYEAMGSEARKSPGVGRKRPTGK